MHGPSDDDVLAAVAAFNTPNGSLDALTLDQLDELGVWAAAVDGAELVDPDVEDENGPHGVNTPDEMDIEATAWH